MYKPNMNEKYLKGRRAGVEGTYGEKGGALRHKGVVEATSVSKNDKDPSGSEDGLGGVASKMYKGAIRNGGGSSNGIGDKALRER